MIIWVERNKKTLNLKIIESEILQKKGWTRGDHLTFAKLMVLHFWIQWGISKNNGSQVLDLNSDLQLANMFKFDSFYL
jgi:hypothetical protein